MSKFRCGFKMLAVMLLMPSLLDFCESTIFPGLRRKPLQYQQPAAYEVNSDFLTQLMEENARRRLQQQFEQQLELINMQINSQRQRQERERERYFQLQLATKSTKQQHEYGQNFDEYSNENPGNNKLLDNAEDDFDPVSNEQYTSANMDFTYRVPPVNKANLNENFEFAVAPSDARFYGYIRNSSNKENNNLNIMPYRLIDGKEDDVLDATALEDYEEYEPKQDKFNFHNTDSKNVDHIKSDKLHMNLAAEHSNSGKLTNDLNSQLIKPNTEIAVPASPILWNSGIYHIFESPTVWAHKISPVRSDWDGLIDKLHQDGLDKEALFSNNQNKIVRKHLVEEKQTNVYAIAVLAGIFAAVAVGFVILGSAWYIFRYKSKATADVEYPAYGVVGPRKDTTLSTDRKLAQSAQMYHYQHQKRQIMAVENSSNNDEGYDMTYVDSDDDNEEADSTVYECPGLAPTGEMEVRNPLFLDDTPNTPALGTQLMAHIITQQPQAKDSNEIPSPVTIFNNKSSKNRYPTDH